MNRRIDPPPPLREQDPPRLGRHRVRRRIWGELGLERREVLHHQRCQEPILTEREQVLLVQRVDVGIRVFFDDAVRDDDRPSFVGGTDAVERETAGQAGDGAEETFERFGEVMRDVVFVHLDHRPPRAVFVRELGFTTDANDAGIICAASHQSVQRIRRNSLYKIKS